MTGHKSEENIYLTPGYETVHSLKRLIYLKFMRKQINDQTTD